MNLARAERKSLDLWRYYTLIKISAGLEDSSSGLRGWSSPFAVEPGAGQRSDKDLHESHRKTDNHEAGGKEIQRNRCYRREQISESPHRGAGAERGLGTCTV